MTSLTGAAWRQDADARTARIRASLDPRSKLQRRVMNCGQPSKWRVSEACRQPGCGRCQVRYVRKQTKAILDRFEDATNSEMSLFTVVVGISADQTDIGVMFQSAQKKLRNLVDYERRRSRSWELVEVIGFLEVDALDASQTSMILPDRLSLLEAIGLPGTTSPSAPIWVITIHGMVRHGAVGRLPVQEALCRAWPLPGQVDLRSFHGIRSPASNIRNIVRYANKHEATTKLAGRKAVAWESDWIRAFYEYLHSWSPGFRKLRFTIGAKGSRTRPRANAALETSTTKDNSDDNDAMPISFNETEFSIKWTLDILGQPSSMTRRYALYRSNAP